jgi:glycosyltransferase involved in cell wall biosynthesis
MDPVISVVIPCLNEKNTISEAVKEALEGIKRTGLSGEVVVSDNGSNDGSQQLTVEAGGRVVNAPVKGYGAAVDFGVRSARGEIVVFADADLSYPFIELPKLIKPILESEKDFVLGTRLKGSIEPKAMPILNRMVGTPSLNRAISFFHGFKTSDCNSGMRAFKKNKYAALKLTCPGMEYASEMLIRVQQTGLNYSEVPISFRKDKRGSAPHLKRWRDGWRHLRFIMGNTSSTKSTKLLLLSSFLCLSSAYLLGFESKHFHTAFALIALSTPMFLFGFTQILVAATRHHSGILKLPLIDQLQRLAANSSPFYISVLLYLVAFFEFASVFFHWWQVGFGDIYYLGPMIRMVSLVLMATFIFCLDLGLGIVSLMPKQPNS